jgi:hypothetical protein
MALNLTPEIEKILAKHKAELKVDPKEIENLTPEQMKQVSHDVGYQMYLLEANLVRHNRSINEDQARQLRLLIEDKLALGRRTAAEDDWWWTPAKSLTRAVLLDVDEVLKKAVKDKKHWIEGIIYPWCGFLNLVYLWVVLSCFSISTTKFETVVMGMLVLTYNTVRSARGWIFVNQSAHDKMLWRIYGDVGRALRLKITVEPERDADKAMQQKSMVSLIDTIGLFIGTLIALWKIGSAALP